MHHTTVNRGLIGGLIPFMRLEVEPGSTWSGKCGLLIRLSPLQRALLADVYVDTYIFYVPHRLVWSEWTDFLAEGPSTWVTSPRTVPVVTYTHDALWYDEPNLEQKSAFPVYSYNLIFNEFFRDPDFPAVSPTAKSSTADMCWPVSPKRHWINQIRDNLEVENPATVDTSGATVTVEEILRSVAEQKDKMKKATYGSRYVDILRSYGVKIDYNMLQRPEMVAHSHGQLNITDVVASDAANLGDLGGYGIGGRRISVRRKSFPEHGTLMGVFVLRPPFMDPHIHDYLDRGGRVYEDYFDPGLTRLPPKQITQQDVTWEETTDNVLGYTPWYEWYRHALSLVPATMENWVLPHLEAAARTSIINASLQNINNSGSWGNNQFTDVSNLHLQFSAVNSLKKISPVPPRSGVFTSGGL